MEYSSEKGLKPYEAIVGTSKDDEYEIIMRAIGNGKQRKYNIYERSVKEPTRRIGFMEKDHEFRIRDIKRDLVRLGDCIDDFYGDYRDIENSIKLNIQNVESSRALDIFEEEYVVSFDKVLEEFKSYMILNPLTDGVLVINVEGVTEIGIVGFSEVFESILNKVVPGYSFKAFKATLKEDGKLKVTGNEASRYTRNINIKRAQELGIGTDKIYNFNFGDEFNEEFITAYNKALENRKKVEVKHA